MWFVILLLLLAPGAARAGLRPELAGSVGGTFAVTNLPNEGGASAALALLWPVATHYRFGVMVHGDDAGTAVDSLRDGNGKGLPYGRLAQVHRAAWGASWRLDGETAWRGLRPFASATWGWYRVADDLGGRETAHVGSTGFSLAAGTRVPLGKHFLVGASVRYHRLFNDREGRFVSAGLDGTWR